MSLNPDERTKLLEQAGEALGRGEVVILPTETLYGVFVKASDAGAAMLDSLTGHPQTGNEPRMTLHLSDLAWIREMLELRTPVSRRLVDRLLPGPTRIILEQPEMVLDQACARVGVGRGVIENGQSTAFRVPDHPVPRSVIRASGGITLARSLGSSCFGNDGDLGSEISYSGLRDASAQGFSPAIVIDDGPTLHRMSSTSIRIGLDGHFEVCPGGPMVEDEVLAMLNTHILFVCTGNTCRSPMAEAIARELIRKLPPSGISFSVESAGVAAGDGYSASSEAEEVLKERGIDLSGHQSKMITPEMIERAQVIFTMTPSHAQALMQIAPQAVHKIFPIDQTHPIADPIGQSAEVYRQVADTLEELIKSKLKELVS